jgi:hypothetical protein
VTDQEIATLIIAAAALLLGIRSELRAHRHDRLVLRVIPKIGYPVGPMPSSEPRIAIEVVNESKFPVTIDEVGFELHGTVSRFAITLPILGDGKPWPRRLEPFDAVITYALVDERFSSVLGRLKRAYASTSTGHTRYGTSPALKKAKKLGTIPPFPRNRPTSGQPGYVNISDFDL